ncbi:glycosyltransferase family 1 protein [Sphingobium sp. EM0848]|uniref:glycosyltransferase family 4 protein n=1 Tax=Sphingobium sp. EM0848 TaxID=2743473 RepID=UPI001C3F7D03
MSVLRRVDSRTGIQRVVRAMLAELTKMTLADMVVQPVFATRKEPYSYCDLAFLNRSLPVQAPSASGVVVPRAGDVFLGLDLAIHLLPIHERQIAHWKKEDVALFVIVYDLLPLLDRRWFTAKLRGRFRSWLKLLARRVDGAICISHAVAAELEEALAGSGTQAGRPLVSTIPLGGDMMATLPSSGLPAGTEALLEEVRSRPTILMVGTIEPRKAHDKALRAFERLWQRQGDAAPRLLIVGRAGWKTEAFQRRLRTHPQSGQGFRWLEDVSDEFLDRLYDAAAGVLMTSYAEGCGLPVLEALAHHRPVLVRDLPVFREIGSQHVFFFRDDGPDALAASIGDFIGSVRQGTGEKMIVDRRSWSNTALSLMNVIEAQLANA